MTEKTPGLLEMSLAKTIEWMFNKAVSMDEFEGDSLVAVDEKVIQLTFTDLAQTFFVTYYADHQHFTVQNHLMGAADAHVKTTVSDWMSHKTQSDEALAQTFIAAMQAIEIDWEEHLSKYVGDTVAFHMGNTVRSGKKNLNGVSEKVGETLREYLQFEINLLPTKSQVSFFNQQVSETAERVEQLQQKIQSLAK